MAEPEVIASKEQLLEACKAVERELVYVSAWKSHVWVRGVTEDERHRINLIREKDPDRNILALWAALVLVDEDGKQFLTDKEASTLAKGSASAIQEIVDASRRISALTPEARAALGKAYAATSDAASSSA